MAPDRATGGGYGDAVGAMAIFARHCQVSFPAGLRPLHQFGTHPLAPMSHFPENNRDTFGPL